MSSDAKGANMIWIIPPLLVLLMLAYATYVRVIIGPTDEQTIDKWGTAIVPAQSPHSTGQDSR